MRTFEYFKTLTREQQARVTDKFMSDCREKGITVSNPFQFSDWIKAKSIDQIVNILNNS